MTAIANRLKLTDEGNVQSEVAFIKNYLKVEYNQDDALILLMWRGILQSADNFCGEPFVDVNGNDIPIPYDIAMWALQTLARRYEVRMSGVTSVNNGSSLGGFSLTEEDMTILTRWKNLLPGL